MPTFMRQGNSVRIYADGDLNLGSSLAAGTYFLQEDPKTGEYYLDHNVNMVVPSKVYGNVEEKADRIWKAFTDRKGSTGVLCSGIKGNGKTLLAKFVSIKGIQNNIPTLIVNFAVNGEQFGRMINAINKPLIVLFDEFEKVFAKYEEQYQLLTVLDGLFTNKNLFFLTCNDPFKIDSHLMNRPGRIFYHFSFKKIDNDVIEEYCKINIDKKKFDVKEQIENIKNIAKYVENFSFDQLQAIVEEMNRFSEDAISATEYLNIKPELSGRNSYTIKVTSKIKEHKIVDFYPKDSNGHPLSSDRTEFDIWVQTSSKSKNSKKLEIVTTQKNLTVSDMLNGKFQYEVDDYIISYERCESYGFSNFRHIMAF